MQRPLKIGTRGSPLALYQARLVQRLLADVNGVGPDEIETGFPIKIYTTSGDKLTGELSEFGGKGLFTKELEQALLSGEVDMAVHSMKDVPTQSQDNLMIGAILEREDPRDGFISLKYKSLNDLPDGALIGTASLRRQAQLRHLKPNVKFTLLRGNVGTRLKKLEAGQCDGTFLAMAGLKRLNMADKATEIISTGKMLGAPAQGAIGIEVRQDDDHTVKAVSALNHHATHLAIIAERAFLSSLDGSCRTPIAALATLDKAGMNFTGEVYSSDGTLRFKRETTIIVDSFEDAFAVGFSMGREIRAEIGDRDIWRA